MLDKHITTRNNVKLLYRYMTSKKRLKTFDLCVPMIVKLPEKQIGSVFFGFQLATVPTLPAGGANPLLDVPVQVARADFARGELHLLCILAPNLFVLDFGSHSRQLLARASDRSLHRA